MLAEPKDVFAFDPGWRFPVSDSRSTSQDGSGIRQAIFSERVRCILMSHTMQETIKRLQTQPSLLAEPTAYFVTQHLIRIYSHLLREAQGQLGLKNLDISLCQHHVQLTLVDCAVKDLKILEPLLDQALQATCIWFSKGLEDRLGLEYGTQSSDADLTEKIQNFLHEHKDTPNDPRAYLVHMCAQTLAQGLVGTMEPVLRRSNWIELAELLGLTPTGQTQIGPSSNQFLEVMSASHYHAVRDALARKRFSQTGDSPWPTAVLDKGRAQGYAELRPAIMDLNHFIPPDEEKRWVERMWKQREELSDIDADALDALSAIWLRQAKHPDQDAAAGVDEILEMRGLLPKKGGQGRRGGYHSEQRMEILRALSHIQNLWMNMTQMEVYDRASGQRKGRAKTMAIKSRAFTITDMMGQLRLDGHMDVSQFIFRPGKVFANFLFGIGRQTALLSARALQYNPYLQAGEKRLARYLSWQWRCQAGNGCSPKVYRVDTLLDVVGEAPNQRYPNRSRDRLEKLMDVLLNDQIVAAWQYERWHEESASKRGWFSDWLGSTLVLEPPAEIQDQYINLMRTEVQRQPLQPYSEAISCGERLRRRRLELGLSQTELAEQLGMHQTAVNRLERGLREGSKATRQKLEAWLLSSGQATSVMPIA